MIHTFSKNFSNYNYENSKIEMSEEKEEPLVFAPKTYQYEKGSLDLEQLDKDPIIQFKKWFDEASKQEQLPESVNLATAELPSGRVSSRVVLFKELDHKGFIIYSNWGASKKAKDINSNPQAALTFFWKNLQRQVRIEGKTEEVPREISQRYFNTRPRGSRIGAWSSPQSSVISGREQFNEVYEAKEKEFEGLEEIPVPDFWGGVRVVPLEIEFWQGRDSRLHDRIVYKRQSEEDEWEIVRIAP